MAQPVKSIKTKREEWKEIEVDQAFGQPLNAIIMRISSVKKRTDKLHNFAFIIAGDSS